MIDVADSNAVYYYHFDGLGSVVALSDSAGDTVQTYEYSVYGQVAASDPNHPNPFLFTARRFDAETGLYDYRARCYNPYIGRFLQTDPIGYVDGINWYAYCGNNPVVFADLYGLCRDSINWSELDWFDKALLNWDAFSEGFLDGLERFNNAITLGRWDEWGLTNTNAQEYQRRYRGTIGSAGESWNRVSAGAFWGAFAIEALGWDIVLWGSAASPTVSNVVQLTQQQQSSITRINNIVRDHVKPSDIAGAVRDMTGNPVPNRYGGYYQHAKEVNEALQGLANHSAVLQGVSHPHAQAALQLAQSTIERVHTATAGAGL